MHSQIIDLNLVDYDIDDIDYKKQVGMHAYRGSIIALLDARWSGFDLFYVVATV